jgi:hypothetical protein
MSRVYRLNGRTERKMRVDGMKGLPEETEQGGREQRQFDCD